MSGPLLEEVRKLMAKKDEIEGEIKELMLVLESQGGVGMNGSLVDDEQFPRADVDVYTVRHSRHRVICLQNDYKDIMKQIELKLHEVHERARLEAGSQTGTRQEEDMQVDKVPARRIPFAKVNLVDRGSPADTAGLLVDDEILQFGSVDFNNFESMQTIATVVQHSKAKPMVVTVLRGEKEVRVSLTPNTWSGRGLLGCNIVPLKK